MVLVSRHSDGVPTYVTVFIFVLCSDRNLSSLIGHSMLQTLLSTGAVLVRMELCSCLYVL